MGWELGGNMFFASPVQNLTLPRAQVAHRPLFEPFLVIFLPFFGHFGHQGYRILTQQPILTPGEPRPQVGALVGLATLAYWCPLLVVEGFSPRLSLLRVIPPRFSCPFWAFIPRPSSAPMVQGGGYPQWPQGAWVRGGLGVWGGICFSPRPFKI